MASYRVSSISAKSIFTSPENIAHIKDELRLRRSYNLTSDFLAGWYEAYMLKHDIERSKIEDVVVWADFMSEEFMRDWRGRFNVSSEQVPYLPYDGAAQVGAEMEVNTPMIKQRPSGRFPKFTLPSAVEDGLDENGEVIIHNEHATIRMYQPLTHTTKSGTRGWRFGKNDPLRMARVAGTHNLRMIDKEVSGSLSDWEVLNRPHTRYPMEQFFTVG
jgi:hypothetical protein